MLEVKVTHNEMGILIEGSAHGRKPVTVELQKYKEYLRLVGADRKNTVIDPARQIREYFGGLDARKVQYRRVEEFSYDLEIKTGKRTDCARIFFADGGVSTFDNDAMAYSVWLALPKSTRAAFRGIGDTRAVEPHDYVSAG